MKLEEALNQLGSAAATRYAKKYAQDLGIVWETDMRYVFQALLNNTVLIPKKFSGSTADEAIQKWVNAFHNAKKNKISNRTSNLPGTIPDPIITLIIENRLQTITPDSLTKIRDAHNICMAAENILGLLLEEYLANKLTRFGWHMAWGSTIRAVDFCNSNGALLQIKNRSNSENSSSSRVRNQTAIQKWYRVNALTNECKWDELNSMIGQGCSCSEEEFEEFIRTALGKNPDALAIDPNNRWLHQ